MLIDQLSVKRFKKWVEPVYLYWSPDSSTSSKSKGHEQSGSSKSSAEENLLGLLENPNLGEPLEDRSPENLPESYLLSFVS